MNKIMTIDGRKISKDILEEIKKEVSMLSFVPVFCDVLVGDDIVSKQYVNLKRKKAESIGIDFYDASFTSTITTEEVISKIHELNKMENMCGIIVQLPLPGHLDTRRILDAIDPMLDVDCLGTQASDIFYKTIKLLFINFLASLFFFVIVLDLPYSNYFILFVFLFFIDIF